MCKRDLSGILSNVGECKKMTIWSWVASLTITLSRFCATWHFAMLFGSLFLHWHACHRLCNEHSEEFCASSNALTTHWEKNQSHIRKSSRASGTQLQISQEIMCMINAIVFFLIQINNQLSLASWDFVICSLKPDLKLLSWLLLLIGKCPSSPEWCVIQGLILPAILFQLAEFSCGRKKQWHPAHEVRFSPSVLLLKMSQASYEICKELQFT